MPERRVDLVELVSDGRLRLQEPDLRALREMLEFAKRDVEAASATKERFAPWAEAMLYEAALRAVRVIVMAGGYRIAADRGHVTAIDAADALTDGHHHRIFVRLHRLRRRRHEFMYEAPPDPGAQELDSAHADVLTLIRLARRHLG